MAIPVPGGELNLSGESWNPETQTLWLVRQNRVVWEVGFVAGPDTFQVLRTLAAEPDRRRRRVLLGGFLRG